VGRRTCLDAVALLLPRERTPIVQPLVSHFIVWAKSANFCLITFAHYVTDLPEAGFSMHAKVEKTQGKV
jgi:hypothetical protein